MLERGNTKLIIDQYVRPQFSAYVGRHFEAIVMDLFELFNQHGLLPFVYTRIGSWWHRGKEIDIVCLCSDPPTIFFCECKWQDHVDGKRIYDELLAKTPTVLAEHTLAEQQTKGVLLHCGTELLTPARGGRPGILL